MEFDVSAEGLAARRTGCIVVGVHAGRELSPSALALDAACGRALSEVLARGDLEGEAGTTLLLQRLPQLAAERVLLVGLGPARGFAESAYRAAVATAVQALRTTGAADAVICLPELAVNGRDMPWKIEQAVLAASDAVYRFDRLKSQPAAPRRSLERITLHVADGADPGAHRDAIARATAIAEGIAFAKDLGNMPGNLCTPSYLADQAREAGGRDGWRVTVLERDELERLGMGGFLAVARGTGQPPKLIVMAHDGGARDEPPIVLVGKGITFDAGGISMKPPAEMDEMKFDMCGAASVFGALRAAARMKLPLNVVGIVPATENMPDGNATKPGDIVRTLSGQTVEILDTDAEGRLVLCDALTYAEQLRPAAVVDVATLTGEIVKALGEVASGLFANDDALAAEVVAAGERAWDRVWRMPMWDEYQDALKSNFADFPNIGTQSDCVVISACFLSRFTKRYPWVHLDVAGTASKSGADKGATGRPVALLAHFLAQRAAASRRP